MTDARLGAVAMAAAAMPLLGEESAARELANNVAGVLVLEPLDPETTSKTFIRHRMAHFGLRCGDVDCCARVMARAWNRTVAMATQTTLETP